MPLTVAVAVETPRHTSISGLLDYSSAAPLPPGTLLRVPLGRREVPGLVWDRVEEATPHPGQQRVVAAALTALPPLRGDWRALVEFAAAYYQRGIGEMALAVLPPELRKLDDTQLTRRLKRLLDRPAASAEAASGVTLPTLSAEQAQALSDLEEIGALDPPKTALLHGATGSGKTEIYLRAADSALQRGHQALVLVPEINLTPQLEARFVDRFPGRVLVSLHSGLTPAQRLRNWLLAHLGVADLVLGT
ncbi:MAG TPA: DEAD/DEAH box helicase family protein, partial [Rubrivivax sp.]|nr:DEAD/DEAH box helicase family protein [Rubrivivax sp.]